VYLFNFYFSIGLFSAFVFVGYWWLYKDRVDAPASPSLMLIRATAYIFVWPVLFWKWFKSEDKTRFITHPEDFEIPGLSGASSDELEHGASRAQREAQTLQQEWEAFVDTLPQCGSHIMYKGTDIDGERLDGRFIFETADLLPVVFDSLSPKLNLLSDSGENSLSDDGASVENAINNEISGNNQQNTQEHYIHRWLRTYDPALYVCNVVPTSFDRFEYITANMIEAGKGKIHCKACGKIYEAKQIKMTDQDTGGWILGELYCPDDHLLARYKKMHFTRSTNK
jgi:hypothetical protein